MTILNAPGAKFCIGVCSLCDGRDLCFGQAKLGGIRYCQDCLKETLAWVQLEEKGQAIFTTLFNKLKSDPKTAKKITRLKKKVSDELAHDIGIGESLRRLMESERPS